MAPLAACSVLRLGKGIARPGPISIIDRAHGELDLAEYMQAVLRSTMWKGMIRPGTWTISCGMSGMRLMIGACAPMSAVEASLVVSRKKTFDLAA